MRVVLTPLMSAAYDRNGCGQVRIMRCCVPRPNHRPAQPSRWPGWHRVSRSDRGVATLSIRPTTVTAAPRARAGVYQFPSRPRPPPTCPRQTDRPGCTRILLQVLGDVNQRVVRPGGDHHREQRPGDAVRANARRRPVARAAHGDAALYDQEAATRVRQAEGNPVRRASRVAAPTSGTTTSSRLRTVRDSYPVEPGCPHRVPRQVRSPASRRAYRPVR